MTEPSQDLVPAELVNPISGELIPTGDLAKVSATLQELKQLSAAVRDAITAFTQAAVAESRRQGTRTLTAGGMTLTVSAPDELEWDIEKLADGLRAAGLPEHRLDELIRATVSYKVDGRVAREIAAASPVYKDAIAAAQSRRPKAQYVTVKP